MFQLIHRSEFLSHGAPTVLIFFRNCVFDKRSEIMKWKEATLKSKQLLDDINKFGKGTSDTIDSLLDCMQDIPFPNITEEDKEHAGVPSILTNVSTMSDINENINAGHIQQQLISSNSHLLNNLNII